MLDLEVTIRVYCPDERESEIRKILQHSAYVACNYLETGIVNRKKDNIDIFCTKAKRS